MLDPCPYHKLDPAKLVMRATESRSRYDSTESLDRAMVWSVLAQGQMSTSLVVGTHVRPQDSPQEGFSEDDHMVGAFIEWVEQRILRAEQERGAIAPH
jgi:hypothetical protein